MRPIYFLFLVFSSLISQNIFASSRSCQYLVDSITSNISNSSVIKKHQLKNHIKPFVKRFNTKELSPKTIEILNQQISQGLFDYEQISSGRNHFKLYNEHFFTFIKHFNTLKYSKPNKLKNSLDTNYALRFRSFLLYLDSLKEDQQIKQARYLSDIFSDRKLNQNKNLKLFKKHLDEIGNFSNQKLEIIKNEIKQKNPKITNKALDKLTFYEHRNFMQEYEKIYYGCKSRKWTPQRKEAASSFKNFSLTIGIPSTLGAYLYQNNDKDHDISGWIKNSDEHPDVVKWYGRIVYEITWNYITGILGAKIISNPEMGVVKKAFAKYFLGRATGLIDMPLYGYLFGTSSEKEAQKKVQKFLSKPRTKKELLKLKKYLESENFRKNTLAMFSKEYREIINGKNLDLFNKENLNFSLLENENKFKKEIKSLKEAFIEESYYKKQGNWIQTGSVGTDRFVFHAAYGFLMMPRDIYVSLLIYNTICLGKQNPILSRRNAFIIYITNRVIMDQVYFFSRRNMINQ